VTELIRGRVYGAVLPGVDGEKPYLVVSNNARNRQLPNVLAVRITTSDKPAMDSIVVLGAADKPLIGRVLCDDLIQLWPDEVRREWGALSPGSLRKVDVGLRAALAL
jgi:mRNA interferase MazF